MLQRALSGTVITVILACTAFGTVGNASTTKGLSSHSENVEPYKDYHGVLYDYKNYKTDASKQQVTFYMSGVTKVISMPFETSPSPHGPWRYNPVYSAESYTHNLQPKGFATAGSKWAVKDLVVHNQHLRSMYGPYTLDWRLIRTSPQTTTSPETAYVKATVNHKVFQIFLFKLEHRYEWDIYRIVAN